MVLLVRCKDLSVHKTRCSKTQTLDRFMTLAFLSLSASSDQVFGCSLSDLCHRESSTVPSFVRMCIDHVENNGGFGCVSLLPGSVCEDMTGNDSSFF